MKVYVLATIIFAFSLLSCEKVKVEESDTSDIRFVPTDVFVKVKGYFTIDKVFNFINSFEHEVESIRSQTYNSDLPPDSLQYVLDYLNSKTYTNDGNTWFVTGYLHYKTNIITIFPKLFDMKNTTYQADWLESMRFLKLSEDTTSEVAGCVIFFHVPEGQEKDWVKIFQGYDFVEWAELNHIIEINPWP